MLAYKKGAKQEKKKRYQGEINQKKKKIESGQVPPHKKRRSGDPEQRVITEWKKMAGQHRQTAGEKRRERQGGPPRHE